MLFDPGVCRLEFGDLVLEVLQRTLDIGVGEDLQRFSEVVGQSEVINDVPAELVRLGAIHPGDCLQQGVVGEFAVQVHDLTDGGIKPSQEHVFDDQD